MDAYDICQIYATGEVIAGPFLLGMGTEWDPFMCRFEIAVNALSETSYFKVLVIGNKARECAGEVQIGDKVAVSGWLKPEYRDEPGSREVEEICICGAEVHFLPADPLRGQGRGQAERRDRGQPEVPVP